MIRSFIVKFFLVASTMFFTFSAAHSQQLQNWMHPEVAAAWKKGLKGQGTSITIIDDFFSDDYSRGNLGGGLSGFMLHGGWVSQHSSMIAKSANIYTEDFGEDSAVTLRAGLNILNLSYGFGCLGCSEFSDSTIDWDSQETSIISYARSGKAVVVKAAGNEYGAPVDNTSDDSFLDFLNRDLIGAQSVIFVGALDKHGTTSNKASLAVYSSIAGSNTNVQNNFLVVGVRGDLTGQYGTSFAAPVVSAYAAILGSKFRTANPTQITNQLLRTARTDTIDGYSRSLHGRGEASLTRALAPNKIK